MPESAFMAFKNVIGLVAKGIQGGTDDVVFIYTSGDAGDGSPGILIPVRRAQTGKGGNYIAAVRIRNFGCHVFGVSSRVDKAHFVTEPLDGSSGNKNRPSRA